MRKKVAILAVQPPPPPLSYLAAANRCDTSWGYQNSTVAGGNNGNYMQNCLGLRKLFVPKLSLADRTTRAMLGDLHLEFMETKLRLHNVNSTRWLDRLNLHWILLILCHHSFFWECAPVEKEKVSTTFPTSSCVNQNKVICQQRRQTKMHC